MARILALPLFGLLLILQMVVFRNIPLLHGIVDLPLLVLAAWSIQDRVKTAWEWALIGGLLMAFVSALPIYVPVVSYLLVTFTARLIIRRVWQTPVISMLITTFVGSLGYHIISMVALRIVGVNLPILESLNQIILPSLLLNGVLAVPVMSMVTDLARWLYPLEVE